MLRANNTKEQREIKTKSVVTDEDVGDAVGVCACVFNVCVKRKCT